MIYKSDKAKGTPSFYTPISLLPVLGKLFEKLLMQKLEPILEEDSRIPLFQLRSRRKHSTINQALSLLQKASAACEERKYCCAMSFWTLRRYSIESGMHPINYKRQFHFLTASYCSRAWLTGNSGYDLAQPIRLRGQLMLVCRRVSCLGLSSMCLCTINIQLRHTSLTSLSRI